ncbi:hypothetical protein niasHS_009509 [Heterodera schachtii]|uniref:MATH domain-containing protein n=1 Tax=Heterodera schachtii TaxID=97005 RepID=A0ABD2J501_HETSC
MSRVHMPEDPQPRARPCRCPTQTKRAGTSGFFVQLLVPEMHRVLQFATDREFVHNYGLRWLGMGIYLLCDAPKEDKNWRCKCSATFRIISQSGVADYKKRETKGENVFYSESNSSGFPNFASFAELMDPSNGFYNQKEDKVTLAIDVTVKDENPVVGDDSDYTESLFCWSSTGLRKFGI